MIWIAITRHFPDIKGTRINPGGMNVCSRKCDDDGVVPSHGVTPHSDASTFRLTKVCLSRTLLWIYSYASQEGEPNNYRITMYLWMAITKGLQKLDSFPPNLRVKFTTTDTKWLPAPSPVVAYSFMHCQNPRQVRYCRAIKTKFCLKTIILIVLGL